MLKRSAHVALYEKAHGALTPSLDERAETLKVDIIAGRYGLHSTAAPAELDLVANQAGWGEQVIEELIVGGFIEFGLQANRFTRLDRLKVEELLDSLAAMEAVCIIRMQYADVTNVQRTIDLHQSAAKAALVSGSRIMFALAAQRLLLTIVAGNDNGNLLQRYVSPGLPALTYAWARELAEVPLTSISETYSSFAVNLAQHDYASAALDVAALRRMTGSES